MNVNVSDVSQIIPYLILTNWDSSNDKFILSINNISGLITIEETHRSPEMIDFMKSKDIKYIHIILPDLPTSNISDFFDSTYKFIDWHISNHKNVMVNCRMGVSRSATIVLNYLIRKYYEIVNMPINEIIAVQLAVGIVQAKRPFIYPNQGFKDQLISAAKKYKERYNNFMIEKII